MSPSTPAAKAPSRYHYDGEDDGVGPSSLSWDGRASQPQKQSSTTATKTHPSLEENAEQVSQLFASTITALAADVSALKHLTTWKDILQRGADNNNNNNEQPSNNENVGEERREEFLESLCDLDDVVTAVEKKVGVLRQIVSEEQRALDQLNLLRQESAVQNENLRSLVERCRQMKLKPTTNNNHKLGNSRRSSHEGADNSRFLTTNATQNNPTSEKKHYNFPNALKAKETVAAVNTSRGSAEGSHTYAEGLWCYLDPVTQEELESVPRTTRGRVQVAVLNEALENIERCFHKKGVKEQRKHQQLVEARQAALAHYDGGEDELDDDEVLRTMVVTEDELRKACSFFAAGESTARTVLAVLKELKRIKQVPAKKRGLLTYKLCLD